MIRNGSEWRELTGVQNATIILTDRTASRVQRFGFRALVSHPNLRFMKKFQRLTSTMGLKFAGYTFMPNPNTWIFSSSTLSAIPVRQIRLNFNSAPASFSSYFEWGC